MESTDEHPLPRKLRLEAGAQAVINGALITANGPCEIEVGPGSFVLTGRSLKSHSQAMRNPREELYFSVLEAGADPERFAEARFRLFDLLSQVVVQESSCQGQRECSACAAALMAGDVDEAIRIAARIASERFGEQPRGTHYSARFGRYQRKRTSSADIGI